MEVFWISTLTEEPLMGGDAAVVLARFLVCTAIATPPDLAPMISGAMALGVIDSNMPKGVTQKVERVQPDDPCRSKAKTLPDYFHPGIKAWVLRRED